MLINYLDTNLINSLYKIANPNIPKFIVTKHFFDRWNERIKKHKFKNKRELEKYINRMYLEDKIQNLKDEFYIIDDDVIVVISYSKDQRLAYLITVYGSCKNNPVIYNLCLTSDIVKELRKYGKLNLNFVG